MRSTYVTAASEFASTPTRDEMRRSIGAGSERRNARVKPLVCLSNQADIPGHLGALAHLANDPDIITAETIKTFPQRYWPHPLAQPPGLSL